MQINKLIENTSNPEIIKAAFEIAKKSHQNQKRISGEEYIKHPFRVAETLKNMKMDSETIAASLLHNTLDGKPDSQKKVELKEIEKKTNKEVVFLIENFSNLKKIPLSLTNSFIIEEKKKERLENLKRMFLAVAKDLRVVLIKLVSRYDNLKTLNYFPQEKQKLYALETLHILVPITDRLGIRKLKRKLEDSSFSYLYPEKYNWLKKNIREKYEKRENYLKDTTPEIKKMLEEKNIEVLDIDYRAKSYWSTYQKLLERKLDFNKIHDLIALRIIVKNISNCYKSIGIIHEKYLPIVEEIDDFIAQPKPNGYRSLHTTVRCKKGEVTEIQIRTKEMHKEAEYGVCAHWAYKEKIDLQKTRERFNWKDEVPKILKDFKIDFFKDKVFAFTPQYDIIELPENSTAVDFAYAIHTSVGNHCQSVKINGKMKTLSTPLQNGDLVEIITSKNKKPSQDWLDFVQTNFAKSNIRKSLKRRGVIFKNIISSLKTAIPPLKKKPKKKKRKPEIILGKEKGGFLIKKAKCCSPKKGDEIKAYITKTNGASIHKTSCQNFKKLSEKFPQRVIKASWNEE